MRLFPTLLLVPALGFAADRPDFSGKWELVLEKSDFGKSAKPTRMTLSSKVDGGAMHAVQTTYTAQDNDSAEYIWYLDGKRHPTDKPAPGYSLTRWEDSTLVSERVSNDGAYSQSTRMTMSRDGKTATETVEIKNPTGTNKEKLIWRKVQ
jgi:hypothetical protein